MGRRETRKLFKIKEDNEFLLQDCTQRWARNVPEARKRKNEQEEYTGVA